MWWVIAIFVAVLYVHLFNAIAKMYLDSDRKMTLQDLYRKIVPPMDFHIRL